MAQNLGQNVFFTQSFARCSKTRKLFFLFVLRQSNGRFVVFQPNASFLTKMTKSLFRANEIGQWNFVMLGNEINMQSKNKIDFL